MYRQTPSTVTKRTTSMEDYESERSADEADEIPDDLKVCDVWFGMCVFVCGVFLEFVLQTMPSYSFYTTCGFYNTTKFYLKYDFSVRTN